MPRPYSPLTPFLPCLPQLTEGNSGPTSRTTQLGSSKAPRTASQSRRQAERVGAGLWAAPRLANMRKHRRWDRHCAGSRETALPAHSHRDQAVQWRDRPGVHAHDCIQSHHPAPAPPRHPESSHCLLGVKLNLTLPPFEGRSCLFIPLGQWPRLEIPCVCVCVCVQVYGQGELF